MCIYQKPLFEFQGKITLLLILGIHFGTSVDKQGIIGDCQMDMNLEVNKCDLN